MLARIVLLNLQSIPVVSLLLRLQRAVKRVCVCVCVCVTSTEAAMRPENELPISKRFSMVVMTLLT